jgi:hypothetical protein
MYINFKKIYSKCLSIKNRENYPKYHGQFERTGSFVYD